MIPRYNLKNALGYTILILSLAVAGCSKKEQTNHEPAHSDAPQQAAQTQTAVATHESKTDYTPSPKLRKTEACPKGAYKTDDGVCSCYYGKSKTVQEGKQRYGDLRPDGSDVLGSLFECSEIDCYTGNSPSPYVICPDIHGCITADGRVYPGLADPNNQYEQQYYVPGGMDTTLETLSEYGDCVLDRTDGIPRFSDSPDARDNYACDRQSCPCGTQTCHNGELCKNNQCIMDKQEPIVLNDSNSTYTYYYSNYTIAGAGCEGEVVDMYRQALETCQKTKDVYCTFDIPEEEASNGADFGLRAIDVETCKGGKRYCHGKGNFPMATPKDADGYVCKTIYDIPGFQSDEPLKAWTCNKEEGCICGGKSCAMNAACIDEQCFCGKDSLTTGYGCAEYCADDKCARKNIGIQCTSESCACGNNTCRKGDFCRDGQCFCDAIPAPGNGYECSQYDELANYYDLHDHIVEGSLIHRNYPKCTSEAGCPCGEHTCMNNTYCISGNCYCGLIQNNTNANGLQCSYDTVECDKDKCDCYGRTIKKGDSCNPPRCGYYGTLSMKGCQCGGVPMDDKHFSCELGKGGLPVAICTDENGCKCGKEVCAHQMACYQNQCVDFLSLKPLPDGYLLNPQTRLPICDSETGCICGKKSCVQGKYCLNGTCFKDPFTKKFDNKVLYYRISNVDDDAITYTSVNYRPVNLLLEDENKKLCEYEAELRRYYYEYDGIYFKQYKDDSYDNHLCSNPQYKNMTIGEFLKNCGTGPVPKDVAVKYCHLGIQFELGELVTEFSVNYSGWVGEDFVFDFANDDSH